jgi:hypothetical protein
MKHKHSWFERIAKRYTRDSCAMAVQQVMACSPPVGFNEIRHTKHPPPLTINFAQFQRKFASDGTTFASGGLCAELTVSQLVATYIPPQYVPSFLPSFLNPSFLDIVP